MVPLAAIIDFLEALAPPELAAQWDNVGLLLGHRSATVDRVMTCLTVTPASAAEAVESGVQLIVSHHPILFRAIQRLTADDAEGRMLLDLAQKGVAVYSPHTALDNATDGINDLLVRQLGLHEIGPLRRSETAARCKVVVFVPDADLAHVSDALFAAGAGNIGQYSECSFRLAGTGTFLGSAASNPTVGQRGRREEATEWRLELVCPRSALGQIVAAIRRAHSYEEPAYDIYPLVGTAGHPGEGRLGRLAAAMSLSDLARRTQDALDSGPVQMIGASTQLVERVAVVCGSGGEFLGDAVKGGADVLLTGELRFHDCLAAQAAGLAVILPGHYATERLGVEALALRLQAQWPQLQVWPSRSERDPVNWIVSGER
jgi:dinuclear metal center YbgI/SA1388 family protein